MKKVSWLLIGVVYFVIRVIWYYLYAAFYAVWEAAYDDAKILYYNKTARRWSSDRQPRSNYNNSGPVFKGPSGDPPVKRRKHRGRRGGRNRHHHH